MRIRETNSTSESRAECDPQGYCMFERRARNALWHRFLALSSMSSKGPACQGHHPGHLCTVQSRKHIKCRHQGPSHTRADRSWLEPLIRAHCPSNRLLYVDPECFTAKAKFKGSGHCQPYNEQAFQTYTIVQPHQRSRQYIQLATHSDTVIRTYNSVIRNTAITGGKQEKYKLTVMFADLPFEYIGHISSGTHRARIVLARTCDPGIIVLDMFLTFWMMEAKEHSGKDRNDVLPSID